MRKYKITKEQILEIEQWGNKADAKKVREEWFPSVFEVELTVGKWYKYNEGCVDWLMCYSGNEDNNYGFNTKRLFLNDYVMSIDTKWIEATPEEVKEALIAEAEKRGYKRDIIITDLYNGTKTKPNTRVSNNFFDWEEIGGGIYQGQMALRDSDGNIIFHNGIWAEIIKVKEMTQYDIEKELGYKIKIVK